MSQISTIARQGFQSGAEAYARGRPDYPPELAGWLTDSLGIRPGRRVLDLGAGTGKFTRSLAATGAEVVAVEPVDAMRARLSAVLPAVTAFSGSAEAIPLPDAALDAVVCATSFHWFATPAALAEIIRVLRPGGRLGLIWNLRDESVPWVARLSALLAPYEGDAPRAYKGAWKAAFPFPGLSPLVEARFVQPHTGPAEDVILNRTRSASFIAVLPDAQREAVIEKVRALIAAEPSLRGKAEVTFPYVTVAYSARRL
jgi:SAM-dependent methyltransferase